MAREKEGRIEALDKNRAGANWQHPWLRISLVSPMIAGTRVGRRVWPIPWSRA